MRLTEACRECLAYYAVPYPRPPVPAGAAWNGRQLRWALDSGLLHVGDSGAHELTEAGRRALEQEG